MIPKTTTLLLPQLIKVARSLSLQGVTQLSANQLFYLNINDAFIHQLFPLLKDKTIKKPRYFGGKLAGAHITIAYPNEGKTINKIDLAKEHRFSIKNLVKAEIGEKQYYVLLVESPSLSELRKKYQLPPLLNFKGYAIDFHITIGVSQIK